MVVKKRSEYLRIKKIYISKLLLSPKNLENVLKLFIKFNKRKKRKGAGSKNKSNQKQINFQNLINSKIIDSINVSSKPNQEVKKNDLDTNG